MYSGAVPCKVQKQPCKGVLKKFALKSNGKLLENTSEGVHYLVKLQAIGLQFY